MDCPISLFFSLFFSAWSALRPWLVLTPSSSFSFKPFPTSKWQHVQGCNLPEFSLFFFLLLPAPTPPSPPSGHDVSASIRPKCNFKPLGMSNTTLLSIERQFHPTWSLLYDSIACFLCYFFFYTIWFWDSIDIPHYELENEGGEEAEESRPAKQRSNRRMNFAVTRQNSFVWFIAHAFAHEIPVCLLIFCDPPTKNGMMKDPLHTSFREDPFWNGNWGIFAGWQNR